MTFTATLPVSLLWAYLAAGLPSTLWLLLVWWPRDVGKVVARRSLRTWRFWIHTPFVAALLLVTWPYWVWVFVSEWWSTRKANSGSWKRVDPDA